MAHVESSFLLDGESVPCKPEQPGPFCPVLRYHLDQLYHTLASEHHRTLDLATMELQKRVFELDTELEYIHERGQCVASGRNSSESALYFDETSSRDMHRESVVVPALDSSSATLDDNASSPSFDDGQAAADAPCLLHRFTLCPEWKLSIDETALANAGLNPVEDRPSMTKNNFWRAKADSQLFTTDQVSPYMISPLRPATVMWQLLGVIVLFVDLVMISLRVFPIPDNVVEMGINVAIFSYWLMDILVSFQVGHHKPNGELVMARRQVALQYMKTWLFFDVFLIVIDFLSLVLSTDELDSVGIVRVGKSVRLLRVMRVLRVCRLPSIEDLSILLMDRMASEYIAVLVSLCRNVGCIIIINHFIACMWYWVGTLHDDAWVTFYEEQINLAGWFSRYFASVHWAITQFTPGSSMLQPRTNYERLYCISVCLFALVAFSMFVSSVTSQIIRLINLQVSMQKKMSMLKAYLHQHAIPASLSVRVHRNIAYALGSNNKQIQAHDVELLDLLSERLREELDMQLVTLKLQMHPFFKVLCRRNRHIMNKICAKAAKEQILSQDDMLFAAGDKAHSMYFVASGTFTYCLWNQKNQDVVSSSLREVQQVEGESWIAEPVLWTTWVHMGDLCAESACDVVALSGNSIRQLVTEHAGMWFPKLYAQAFVIVLNGCAEKEAYRPLMSDLQAGIHNLFPLNKVLSRDVRSLRKLAQKQCPFEAESEEISSSSFV